MTTDEKKQKQLDNKINKFISSDELNPKYLKNIRADVCHSQSWMACGADGYYTSCQLCGAAPYKYSDRKKKNFQFPRYGISFAQLYNNRHKKKNKFNPKYPEKRFFATICPTCLKEVEKRLDICFVKDYAP